MRSTVRIDDDLMTALRAHAQAEGLSLTRMLNRALRAGLAASIRFCNERERYEEATVRMGRPRFDLDKALALTSDLEDEEIIRKTARKTALRKCRSSTSTCSSTRSTRMRTGMRCFAGGGRKP